MKNIKEFNEYVPDEEDSKLPKISIKVKDLVEYLQSLDQEMEVYLDKNGWESWSEDITPQNVLKDTALFYIGKNHLTINN